MIQATLLSCEHLGGETPPPRGYFHGIDHDVLLKEAAVVTRLIPRGGVLSTDGKSAGLVLTSENVETLGEISLVLVNHNNRRKSLKAYIGLQTPVCGIPLFHIDLGKHTNGKRGNLGRKLKVLEAKFHAAKNCLGVEVRGLQMSGVSDPTRVIDGAIKRGYIPRVRASNVWPLLRFGGSKWDLLEAFATVAVKNPPLKQVEQVYGVRELLRNDHAH